MANANVIKVGKQEDGSVVSILLFTNDTKNTHRFDEDVEESMPVRTLYQRKEKGFGSKAPQGVIITVAPLPAGEYTTEEA